MNIRNGSIVNIVTAELGGPGASNGSENGAEVISVEDAFIQVLTASNKTVVFPWRSVRSIEVITH